MLNKQPQIMSNHYLEKHHYNIKRQETIWWQPKTNVDDDYDLCVSENTVMITCFILQHACTQTQHHCILTTSSLLCSYLNKTHFRYSCLADRLIFIINNFKKLFLNLHNTFRMTTITSRRMLKLLRLSTIIDNFYIFSLFCRTHDATILSCPLW